MTNELQKNCWPGWETVGLIGRGSFGAVYEIQRSVFGDVEKAALKVISIPQNDSDIEELYSDGYDDESITSSFKSHLKSIVAEYTLMRKMNGSANIVNCDDIRYIQHEDGIGWDIFIKMELLTPLTKALPAQIPEQTVFKLATDMCAALELCKKHEIVHRDIKPQNIFVSPNGDYKLGDFGIAKTIEKTTGGTKIGTYKYMAPEVYNNQPYGMAADIYSLGLVLYWLLNERRMPFMPLPPEKLTSGMDESSRNRRFSGEPLPAPAHGSERLKRIVLKACAYDPADRYASAAEMLQDLKNEPTIPERPPKTEPGPEPVIPDEPPVSDPNGGKKPPVTKNPDKKPQKKGKLTAQEKKKKDIITTIAITCVIAILVICYFTIHFWSPATCSQASECTLCGKVGTTLPHEYSHGYCQVCGVEEPYYTGLKQNEDGTWYYYENGVHRTDYLALVEFMGKWYYIEWGQANWSYTGLVQHHGNDIYVENGETTWLVNGLVECDGTWYYVEENKVIWNYTGLVLFAEKLYYVQNGTVNWEYNGKAKYNGYEYIVINGVAEI